MKYIDRQNRSEQKNSFEYIVPPPTIRLGTINQWLLKTYKALETKRSQKARKMTKFSKNTMKNLQMLPLKIRQQTDIKRNRTLHKVAVICDSCQFKAYKKTTKNMCKKINTMTSPRSQSYTLQFKLTRHVMNR